MLDGGERLWHRKWCLYHLSIIQTRFTCRCGAAAPRVREAIAACAAAVPLRHEIVGRLQLRCRCATSSGRSQLRCAAPRVREAIAAAVPLRCRCSSCATSCDAAAVPLRHEFVRQSQLRCARFVRCRCARFVGRSRRCRCSAAAPRVRGRSQPVPLRHDFLKQSQLRCRCSAAAPRVCGAIAAARVLQKAAATSSWAVAAALLQCRCSAAAPRVRGAIAAAQPLRVIFIAKTTVCQDLLPREYKLPDLLLKIMSRDLFGVCLCTGFNIFADQTWLLLAVVITGFLL